MNQVEKRSQSTGAESIDLSRYPRQERLYIHRNRGQSRLARGYEFSHINQI